ncbi:MAG: HEAT repeat domain-containing protein [Rhodothermales bacterium]
MTIRPNILVLAVLLWAGFAAAPAGAQPIVHLPDAQRAASLGARRTWALDAARGDRASDYWVAYSIERLMHARSFIGSFSSDRQRREPSLSLLLYGREVEPLYDDDNAYDALPVTVRKEVVYLVRYDRNAVPVDVTISSISLAVGLDGLPLYWLGKADAPESIAQMRSIYEAAQRLDAREHALMAVALHRNEPAALDFLLAVLDVRTPAALREKAAFWMGQQSDPRALAAIEKTMRNDPSMEVREQAVFALSQMDLPEATDLLIETARHEKVTEVRKKAVFWLGQKASKQVLAVLSDIVAEESDTEVQKQALYALAQMPAEDGVPVLIRIARTHPNVRLRKQAIYMLGESDDPRALETLVELARMSGR